jgi:hypothetical protein
LEPNIRGTSKPRRGRLTIASANTLQRRIANITEKFDGDTQRIRSQLILDLQTLSDIANQKVNETTNPKQWKERLEWIKMAAYISQVINSISKTYDLIQIKLELDRLRKTIQEMDKHDSSQPQKRNRETPTGTPEAPGS